MFIWLKTLFLKKKKKLWLQNSEFNNATLFGTVATACQDTNVGVTQHPQESSGTPVLWRWICSVAVLWAVQVCPRTVCQQHHCSRTTLSYQSVASWKSLLNVVSFVHRGAALCGWESFPLHRMETHIFSWQKRLHLWREKKKNQLK